MRAQLLMGAVLIFIFGTMFSLIASGRWLLNGEMDIFKALSSFNTVTFSSGGGWDVLKGPIDFFNGVATALMWDYPFLSDPWAVIIKFPLWVVSIGVVWGFVEVFVSVVQGVVGTIRNLIPGI